MSTAQNVFIGWRQLTKAYSQDEIRLAIDYTYAVYL
jgi:hypothetical protein